MFSIAVLDNQIPTYKRREEGGREERREEPDAGRKEKKNKNKNKNRKTRNRPHFEFFNISHPVLAN